MGVKIIVAYCKGNGIGKNNTLPWYIPDDLKHFSKLTKGNNKNIIVMGRKTWESLPKKPLPNRFNAILSKSLTIDTESTKTFNSLQKVIEFSRQNNYEDLWIIGGEQVYRTALEINVVDEIHVSEINEEYECDVFFPDLSSYGYQLNFESNIGEKVKYKIYL